MTRDEEVLVSSSGHHTARRFHRQLGETKFSVCSRIEPDAEPDVVSREDAEDDGLKPCSLCRFPHDSDEPRVVADGGER